MSGVAATDAARPLIVFNDDVDVVMLVMRHANETWELVTKAEDEGSSMYCVKYVLRQGGNVKNPFLKRS